MLHIYLFSCFSATTPRQPYWLHHSYSHLGVSFFAWPPLACPFVKFIQMLKVCHQFDCPCLGAAESADVFTPVGGKYVASVCLLASEGARNQISFLGGCSRQAVNVCVPWKHQSARLYAICECPRRVRTSKGDNRFSEGAISLFSNSGQAPGHWRIIKVSTYVYSDDTSFTVNFTLCGQIWKFYLQQQKDLQ